MHILTLEADMDGERKVLDYIYDSVSEAISYVDRMLEVSGRNEEFIKLLLSELSSYRDLREKADKVIENNDMEVKYTCKYRKKLCKGLASFRTMRDSSVCHIAEILLYLNFERMVESIKASRKYSFVNDECKELLAELIKIEEQSIDNLKEFI